VSRRSAKLNPTLDSKFTSQLGANLENFVRPPSSFTLCDDLNIFLIISYRSNAEKGFGTAVASS
jgi:hypothetical protein